MTQSRAQIALELANSAHGTEADNLANEVLDGGVGRVAYVVAGILLHLADDIRARQCVPAGNQASAERIAMAERLSELEEEQAPTAPDEMRALQEGAGRDGAWRILKQVAGESTADRDLIERLQSQLTESREALARVEAERDELKRQLEEADGILGAARRTVSRVSHEALGKHGELVAAQAELRKRDAVIEAARKAAAYMNPHGEACRNLRDALAVLDQAASEAEVAERAIVVGSTWECEPDQHCDGRHVVEDIEPREAPRKALIGFKCRGVYTAIGERTFRADHAWVSEPEATESATKETPT